MKLEDCNQQQQQRGNKIKKKKKERDTSLHWVSTDSAQPALRKSWKALCGLSHLPSAQWAENLRARAERSLLARKSSWSSGPWGCSCRTPQHSAGSHQPCVSSSCASTVSSISVWWPLPSSPLYLWVPCPMQSRLSLKEATELCIHLESLLMGLVDNRKKMRRI